MISIENDIIHNVKLKHFPLVERNKMTVCSKAIFREPGWEPIGDKPFIPKPQDPAGESRDDSVRRAKTKVYEIAMLNRFTHFITWTLAPEQVNRYDPKEVSKRLKKFLDNQKQRREAAYLIIAEHHKDGAIHMHGLIRGNFDFTDSGKHTKKGQKVYNMPQWKLGWSTAIELDGNVLAIARYITKYITKDFQKIFGHYYYAGGDIVRNASVTLLDTDYGAFEGTEYKVEDVETVAFKYADIDAPTEGDYPDDIFDTA
jgi:hypothetical protein